MTNIHQYLHYMQCADTTGCVSALCVVLLFQGVSKWGGRMHASACGRATTVIHQKVEPHLCDCSIRDSQHLGTFVWSSAPGSLWLFRRVMRPARRTRCGGLGALGQGSQLATTPRTSLRSLSAAVGLLPARTEACLHG